MIFGAYVNRLEYDDKVTRFFYLNVVVEWDSTPEDSGLADGGRINVVLFRWLFNAADLGYFDQWGEPPSLGRGIYSREAARAERKRFNYLACVNRCQVVITCKEEYVAQLFRMYLSDFEGQEYLEEIFMAQMEIKFMS